MNDLQSSGTIEEIGGVLERGAAAAAGWMEKSSHRMDGQLSNFFFRGGGWTDNLSSAHSFQNGPSFVRLVCCRLGKVRYIKRQTIMAHSHVIQHKFSFLSLASPPSTLTGSFYILCAEEKEEEEEARAKRCCVAAAVAP